MLATGIELAVTDGCAERNGAFLSVGDADKQAAIHTERTPRYDLGHVGTQAKRSGAGYTLEGEKRAVLAGGAADTLIVSARTSGGETDAAGISLFLVDRSAPGVTLKEYRTIDELRAADVWLSGVLVPAEARLGDGARAAADRGRRRLRTALLCAEAVGASAPPTRRRFEYIKTRRQFRGADRQLPGAAASHGGHGDQLRQAARWPAWRA
jgi:alkylation response protein AidB-like acyl-CoA dehydrogenase